MMCDDELTYNTFVRRVVNDVPELRTLFKEHLHVYGEILPHVFMGDVTRYVLEDCRLYALASGSIPGVSDTTRRILNLLERAMGSIDSDLRELVAVSFLENLDCQCEGYHTLRAALGTRLRQELNGED